MNGSRQDVGRLLSAIGSGVDGSTCIVVVCQPFPLLD
jgi:hypothetical protein